MYATLWNKYYSLDKNDSKEDIKISLNLLADIAAEESKAVTDYTAYKNLANLYYQCEEKLLLDYNEVTNKDFPPLNDHEFDLNKKVGDALEKSLDEGGVSIEDICKSIKDLSDKVESLVKTVKQKDTDSKCNINADQGKGESSLAVADERGKHATVYPDTLKKKLTPFEQMLQLFDINSGVREDTFHKLEQFMSMFLYALNRALENNEQFGKKVTAYMDKNLYH